MRRRKKEERGKWKEERGKRKEERRRRRRRKKERKRREEIVRMSEGKGKGKKEENLKKSCIINPPPRSKARVE